MNNIWDNLLHLTTDLKEMRNVIYKHRLEKRVRRYYSSEIHCNNIHMETEYINDYTVKVIDNSAEFRRAIDLNIY